MPNQLRSPQVSSGGQRFGQKFSPGERTLAHPSGVPLDSARPAKSVPVFVGSQKYFDWLRCLEMRRPDVSDRPTGEDLLDLAEIDATYERSPASRPSEHEEGCVGRGDHVDFPTHRLALM